MKEIQYYVLFPNHDNGMRLHRALKKAGLRSQISPTPRQASKCCGISLVIKKEEIPMIQKCIEDEKIHILDIVEIQRDINPNRDKYC